MTCRLRCANLLRRLNHNSIPIHAPFKANDRTPVFIVICEVLLAKA